MIKPKTLNDKTKSEFFLPPGVHQKEKLYSGNAIKVSPGYPRPANQNYNEPWKDQSDKIKYIPFPPKLAI